MNQQCSVEMRLLRICLPVCAMDYLTKDASGGEGGVQPVAMPGLLGTPGDHASQTNMLSFFYQLSLL